MIFCKDFAPFHHIIYLEEPVPHTYIRGTALALVAKRINSYPEGLSNYSHLFYYQFFCVNTKVCK